MDREPAWLEPRTAYIHVPFCAHHCGYCDFAVSVGGDHRIPQYLDALAVELQSLGEPKPVDFLFIGGGTPTHLNEEQLRQLLSLLRHWFPWHPESKKREFSIESTPDSLDAGRVAVLAEFGVNRVSIGVQSFQNRILAALDRKHRVDQIARSIDTVRNVIPSFSLDLIFAAPGVTQEEWLSDLQRAIKFQPGHISTYGLTYETETPLGKKKSLGLVNAVSEDDELRMYETSIDVLTNAGFEHYEISNFAKPGERCEHNERYWANEAYYGFGVGAASYVRGTRTMNIRNTDQYIRKVLSGESVVLSSESLTNRDRAFETMAVQLRRCEGIGLKQFQYQTGFDLIELTSFRLTQIVELGLLERTADEVRLTRRGKCVADGVIESLLSAGVSS